MADAFIGGGFGLAGSAISAAASFALQEDAQKFAKGMYKHRYRYTMADMRKAGLNPILAYSQGVGGGVSAPMGSAPDFAGAMTQGAESGARRGKIKTEKALIGQQTITSAAQAADALASAGVKKQQQALIGAQTRLTTAQAVRAEAMMPVHDAIGGVTKQIKQVPEMLRPIGPTPQGRRLLDDMFKGWQSKGKGYRKNRFYKKRRTSPR